MILHAATLQYATSMESELLNRLDHRQLGERLKNARKARGLTQDSVATQIGILRTTLVAIEKGTRKVAPSELIKMARMYGRPVSEFVSGGQTKNLLCRNSDSRLDSRPWPRVT